MQRLWRFLVLLGLIVVLIITPSMMKISTSFSSNEVVNSPVVEKDQIEGYPVILDGKNLFFMRRGVASYSAQDRANTINNRLIKIAEDDSISLDEFVIEKSKNDNSIYLRLGESIILTVTPEDADSYRETQENLAQRIQEIIKNAIKEYRELRQPSRLLRSFLISLLATFIFFCIVWGIIKLSAKIFPVSKRWVQQKIPSLRVNNFQIISAHQIGLLYLKILQFIRLLILFVFFYTYLSFIFALFPWTRALSDTLFQYVSYSLNLVFNGIAQYIPNIFIVSIIVIVVNYSIRSIKPLFNAIENGSLEIPGFYADWAKPTYNLIFFFIIALAFVIAFPYLPGFNSPAFRGVSVFLGVLFSLGSTSAIANLVGGVILIYTRAFQLGDRIQIGDVLGDVIEKTILVTRIKTATNKIITIPNSSLLNTNIINFSVSSRELNVPLILQTTITLGYDLPWRKVHATLIEAAMNNENILKEPKPFVLQTSLDDFYVSYQLNVYTDKPNQMVMICSELHQNIQDKCNELGIEIMSPHYRALRDGNPITIPTD
jgi:small-conductance mechanosensitive channel